VLARLPVLATLPVLASFRVLAVLPGQLRRLPAAVAWPPGVPG
jgi:hypothetical protein